jgi:hypothetical protein
MITTDTEGTSLKSFKISIILTRKMANTISNVIKSRTVIFRFKDFRKLSFLSSGIFYTLSKFSSNEIVYYLYPKEFWVSLYLYITKDVYDQ